MGCMKDYLIGLEDLIRDYDAEKWDEFWEGEGMRPALGLTLMFVITRRLLAFKHKVLSRYYAPDAPGAGILKRKFEAEF